MGIFDDIGKFLPAINPGTFGPFADEIYGPGGASGAGGDGYGTYGEGHLGVAKRRFDQLQNDFRSGKISAEEYSKIAEGTLPQLREAIRQIYGSGSAGANAGRAAGGDELLKYIRDYDIMRFGKNALGRDLTIQEIDQFRPFFEGGDTQGQAALAEYARQEAMSPAGLARKAPQYYDQSKELISQILGREARQDELDYYGRQLAAGVTPYELRSYIEQTPEYRTNADTKFRSGLASELEGYDRSFFNKGSEDVISRYARMGTQHSPALDMALTNLMGDIARERSGYLAKLSADQYGGNKDAAREDYRSTMDRYIDDRRYDRGRSDMVSDRLYGRANEISDYNRQREDYFQALAQGGGRQKMKWGQLAGGAIGAGIGGFTGGPAGAGAGWQIGSGLGGGFDYYNY